MTRKTTPTYVLLNQITLLTASNVTFSNIPQNYSDLRIVYNGAGPLNHLGLRFNGDAGANYPRVAMGYSGGGIYSNTATPTYFQVHYSGNTSGEVICTTDILDYSASDKHKTGLSRSGVAGIDRLHAHAARWANTSPIISIQMLGVDAGSLPANATVSLYGIVA
jgi:hypothetical protein